MSACIDICLYELNKAQCCIGQECTTVFRTEKICNMTGRLFICFLK